MTSNIFTVPPGAPFLKALARAVLNGDLPAEGGAKPDPLTLPKITLLLPTRRAARAAQEAFLAQSGARALLMPTIRPISEGDEDLSLLSSLISPEQPAGSALDLPPAIPPLIRTLTLMQLVLRWRAALGESDPEREPIGNNTPAQAANLANELAKLMDDIEREGVSISGIKDIVPETYSEHWQKTVDFLKIVTEYWPAVLAADGVMSPQARRNALILAEASRIAKLPPETPVIVAGVTGSVPATVTLMRAVAMRKGGAIVLPALDQSLDDESWQQIVPDHPEHPQFGLKKLIDALGVDRSTVRTLPGIRIHANADARAAFISEAMRPSATTSRWHTFVAETKPGAVQEAIANVSLIEAPSSQDEAETVALILREAVETPGRTAALVSPDRLLARRVAIRLEAWGIRVDDSAGRPFAKTVPGTFLALVNAAVVNDFAPADTMALLKHPLCRVKLKAFDVRRFGRALEIAAFRTPYLGRGLDGIEAALQKSDEDRAQKKRQQLAAQRLWDEDREGAHDLVARLQAAFAPLVALYAANREASFKDFARAHAQAAEALAALPDEDEDREPEEARNPLWQGDAGSAAQTFFTAILDPQNPDIAIRPADYADLYASLLARENVRERTPVHPRIAIWGPYEARLQQPDILILGSLNEGTWPETTEPGAWLNRPMRQSLGLPSPEEEIGRAAHDITCLLGASTVYLTRAQKVKGVPAVPSRWLLRIKALLDGMKLHDALKPELPWLAWARARDAIDEKRRLILSPPAPAPAIALRPRKLSVTNIEDWTRNPYAIFAKHILKLEPLPQLGASPDQSLRGALVHDVLSQFANKYPGPLPPDVESELERIARASLESYTGHPKVAAFWMPRLARFLSWFTQTEAKRRDGVSTVISETSAKLVIPAPAGPFTLSARADRIDDLGTAIVITDYKTGSTPNDKAVISGRSPQLPLEAAIALGESGFPNLQGRSIAALKYIRASGGEPAGEERNVKVDDIAALAESARAGLARLIAAFDDPAKPYRAIRRPGYRYDYDDYAQLARVAEWSAHVDEDAGA